MSASRENRSLCTSGRYRPGEVVLGDGAVEFGRRRAEVLLGRNRARVLLGASRPVVLGRNRRLPVRLGDVAVELGAAVELADVLLY